MTRVSMLSRLCALVRKHEEQIAELRASVAVQFKRTAEMQAELDALPHARKRRNILRKLLGVTSLPGHHHSKH
jgi:hypothetical protein